MVVARCCCRLRPLTAQSTLSLPPITTPTTTITLPLRLSRRTYATPTSTPNPPIANSADNPILSAYLSRKSAKEKTSKPSAPKSPPQGTLTKSSIFAPIDTTGTILLQTPSGEPLERNPATMAARLDPNPSRRRRWERKMVIHAIQRRGRLSRTQMIRRTEREITLKSDFWKTSVKKLSPIARQIAGKSIEDAITQMEYSKKLIAQDVLRHLISARNRAVVERGMGLGEVEGRTGSPVTVKLNDGRTKRIQDRTGIYVAQAWVGKGHYGQDMYKRARGRIDQLRLPQTSITVLLKEEATRIREHEERVKREKAKKPWTPLPDRPITTQRPFYCW